MLSVLAIAKSALTFILGNYKPFLLAVGAFFLFRAGVDYGASKLKDDLSTCKTNSILLQSNMDAIKSNLASNDEIIKKLKLESEMRQSRFNKAIKEASSKIEDLKGNATKIILEPPKMQDDCVAAKKLMSEHLN